MKLAGTYDYDDEGVPAQRVNAVENGILKNFLMSRMPITELRAIPMATAAANPD